jgi:26S proteasome regulatory subunit T4
MSDHAATLKAYVDKVIQHRKFETGLKTIRQQIAAKSGEFDKTEEHIKALQSVGQIIGEVLTKLDEEREGERLIFMEEKI